MNVRDQISKLEALLQRVKHNAAKPRYAVSAAVEDSRTAAPIVSIEEASIEDLEELDDDFVELVSGGGASPNPTAVDIDFDDGNDSALGAESPVDGAASPSGPGGETPLETPPPESGRQEVGAEMANGRAAQISGASDVDDLLEADIPAEPVSVGARGAIPTMEQLGETVELEGADAPDANLELDEPLASVTSTSAVDTLEVSLPGPAIHGAYDATLEAPPSAREALARRDKPEPLEPAPETKATPERPERLEAEVVARPPVVAGTEPAAFETKPRRPMTDSFAALLDDSLALGG